MVSLVSSYSPGSVSVSGTPFCSIPGGRMNMNRQALQMCVVNPATPKRRMALLKRCLKCLLATVAMHCCLGLVVARG